MKTRIMIATPVDGVPESAMVPYGHARALSSLKNEMITDLEIMWGDQAYLAYPADLVRARSRAIRQAQECKVTHVLWLDSDIIPKPGFLGQMLATGHDFIGCPYPRKRVYWEQMRFAGEAEEQAYQYSYHFESGPGVAEGERKQVNVVNGCVEVTRVAMGCMLTSMRALNAMVDKYRDALWFTDVIDGKHFDCVAVFQLMMSPLIEFRGRPFRTLFSEDYSFCERYNETRAARPDLGLGPIQMLVSHPADHVGGHLFRGSPNGLAAAR